MKMEMARFINNREQFMEYLAQENIVPVKAPPWAEYPFELRRNDKTAKGQVGQHMIGTKTLPLVMNVLGVHEEESCKAVRERIKSLRKKRGYT